MSCRPLPLLGGAQLSRCLSRRGSLSTLQRSLSSLSASLCRLDPFLDSSSRRLGGGWFFFGSLLVPPPLWLLELTGTLGSPPNVLQRRESSSTFPDSDSATACCSMAFPKAFWKRLYFPQVSTDPRAGIG